MMSFFARVPSEEEQLNALGETLRDSKAFARLRGLLCATGIDLLAHGCHSGMEESASGQEWDLLVSSMTEMHALLSRYCREGWTAAEGELIRGLSSPAYRMAWEVNAFESTLPYTVIVLDPTETFAVLGWLSGISPEELPDATERLWNASTGRPCDGLPDALGRIVNRTNVSDPSGGEAWAELRRWAAFFSAFAERLDVPSARRGRKAVNLVPPVFARLVMAHGGSLHSDPWGRPSFWTAARITSNSHAVPSFSCAFALPRSRADALGMFSAEAVRDGRVAGWEFHLPAAHRFVSPKKRYDLGFHPEREHARWRNERPAFASVGVSNGLGAIVLPHTEERVDAWYPRAAPHLMLTAW